MYKKWFIGIVLLGCLNLMACSDNEIGTNESMDVNRYEFPQGDNAWDKEIKQIADDWNMFIIYKDFTGVDLNKSLLAPGYYDPVYEGEKPNDNDVLVYLRVMKKWILSVYDKNKEEDLKKLPVYFYFVNNYHDQNNNQIRFNLNGFDYWALSFTSEELTGSLPPVAEHGVACTFRYRAIKDNFDNGKYAITPEFRRMTDYVASIGTKYISFEEWKAQNPTMNDSWYTRRVPAYERDKNNVYTKRGFLPEVNETFDGETGYPRWMPLISREWATYPPVDQRVLSDFLNYVRFAMSYPEEKTYELYPVNGEDPDLNRTNQLIHDKYDFVVDYMQTIYGIDLKSYANILK